jgi:hypothetical protein
MKQVFEYVLILIKFNNRQDRIINIYILSIKEHLLIKEYAIIYFLSRVINKIMIYLIHYLPRY